MVQAVSGQFLTFLVSKSIAGRIGWKVMAEQENIDLQTNQAGVAAVMERIRYKAGLACAFCKSFL